MSSVEHTWFSRLFARFLHIHFVTVVQGFQIAFYRQLAVEERILGLKIGLVEIVGVVEMIAT